MQHIRPRIGWILLGGIIASAVGQSPLVAQGRQQAQQLDRLLVLTPLPSDPGDSAVAVAIGDEFRSRLEGKARRQFNVISKERIGEALEASGFSAETLLDPHASEQLARFLQANAYIIGSLDHNSQATVHLRLVDIRRTGLGGWVHLTAAPGAEPRAVGDALANEMEAHFKAAEQARACVDRRDRRDFSGAKDRARRAFESVPNHVAAAMCLAIVAEANREPADSQIAALEMAVRGDSTNGRAWEMLGRQYQVAGDTLKAADAFMRQLAADPTDSRLRTGVAALLITQKQYERARELLDEGLRNNPTDLQALQLKARACEDGELWPCLVEALSAQYDVDTTLSGNAEFYGKVFGAAQSSNDTVAMLHWSAEAVDHLPTSVAFWRARAAALKTAGKSDSALLAYERIAALDSTDIASPLQIAEILMDGITIDTTVPLDTARLEEVFGMLSRVAALRTDAAGQPTDSAVWRNVAARYFAPGAQLVQKRVSFPLGIRWLEEAIEHDLRRELTTQASFFVGLAYFFQLGEVDARTRESKSCADVGIEEEMIGKAKAAMTAGASLQESTATQILQYLGQYEGLIPSYKQSFKCP